ncbi:MAG: tyrosine-type recombinase/integrase [Solirubrobacteraceae bacterium]
MRWGSGQVLVVERKRGAVWYAQYRDPSGGQHRKLIGPVWTGRGRPPEGHYTKRGAEDWLRDRQLEDAQRAATAPANARTGTTFAEAAEEYLRYAEQDRGCKPSTIRGYRSQLNAHLLPAFGSMRIEEITEREIERWRAGMAGSRRARSVLSNKTKNHQLVLMHAILRRAVKVYGLPRNPLENVDRYRVRSSGDIQVFSPEEIWSLVRAAKTEIDGAIFLTAAFTGMRRGEVLGLRWRDVDFDASTIRVRASYAAGKLTTPKSGKVRSVPMAPDVASALARTGQRQRFTGDDDFVFAGESGMPLNPDAISSRYEIALETAGLRRLRFHDLRHTFGTRMIREADIRRVQEWMGHADIQTTMKYLHYESRAEDAQLVAKAFRTPGADEATGTVVSD